ncbi:MAG: hypothetical protein ACE5GS_08845 [Kiloniellaceae bacterium]
MAATQAIPVRLALALALLLGPAERIALGDDEAQGWIAYNQDLLKRRLREPESARFRNVFFSRKAGVPVACGEVEAKTASGAMSGFQRFVGAGSVGVFLPGDVDDFETLWRHFCR